MKHIEEIGCNNATNELGNVFTGNVIPNNWYKEITTKSGNPDLPAITMLAEIVYWYRPSKNGSKKFQNDIWQTSYNHFETKFGYNRQKLRRTFVRLEELKLIRREVRTIKHYGQKFSNILFIRLLDNSLLGSKPVKKDIAPYKKISTSGIKNDIPLLQNCSDNIDIKTKKENNRSNVKKLEEKEKNISVSKKLMDFHPLSNSDIEILNRQSRRGFDLNSTNEILLSMAKKLTNHVFRSKQSFLSYMSKALAGELRQATKINNKSFRINTNKDEFEKNNERKEKFLVEIENSLCNNYVTTIKQKISGNFELNRAYDMIKTLNSIKHNGKEYEIYFDKMIKLSSDEKQIILREARFILGQDVSIRETLEQEGTKIVQNQKTPNFKETSNSWVKIRKKAKENFGDEIDKSWFSRINPEIDQKNQSVVLKADTSFIRNWIETNYKDFLTYQFQVEGLALETVYSKEVQ